MPPRSPKKPAPVIVKRSADERKKLPPELEAFARSQDEKLRLPRKREDTGRLRDPREGYTIAGVSNRDARAVYDARAEQMRALWAEGAADEEAQRALGGLLHDLLRLSLWRARRLTGFDAFVEQVVGLPGARARELAAAFGQESGESDKPLSERDVAIWLRTEAGLFEGDGAARARIEMAGDEPRLTLSLLLSGASAGLAGVGARHVPLAREQAEAAGVAPRSEGPAKARAEGGAKLLTRKRAAEDGASEELSALAGEDEQERGDERESEAELDSTPPAPARARTGGDRPLKRKTFADDGGGRSFAARGNVETKRGSGERRDFADRGGFEKPRFQKASFGERRAGGERPAFGDKRGFGKERAFAGERSSERPQFGEKRSFGEKRGFGDKRSFGEKRGFGDKRSFEGERGSERPSFADKRGFGKGGFAKGGFGKGAGAKGGFGKGASAKAGFGRSAGGKGGFGKGAGDARREGGFQDARGGEKRPFKKGGFAVKAGGGFGAKRGRDFGDSGARGAKRGGFVKGFAGKGKGAKAPTQGRTGRTRRDDAGDE